MRAGQTEVVARTTSRGLARAGFIGIAGAAAAALFGWLRAKGLAVTLGPAGVGLYGQVWAFVIYASGFASLGIGVGTTALVAFHRERNERDEIASVARNSLVLPALTSAGLALVTLAFASLLAPPVLGEHRGWLIVLAALSIPFATMQVPLQHVLQGFEDVGGQNVVYAIYSAVFTVAVVAGAYVGGLYGAVVGLAIGNAVLCLLYLGRTGRLLARARAPLSRARRGVGSAGPLVRIGTASLAITVTYGAADLAVRTTLLHTHGSRSAGYWFALLTLSIQFIGLLAGTMSYFTAPLAARSAAGSDREETQRLLDDTLRLATAVIMPAIVLLIAIRHGIVGILFSDAFDPISRWLPTQLAGDAVRTVGWVLGVALVPLGLTRAWLVTGLGASIVFAGVGSLFAAHWGLGGAAAAWLITWTASTTAVVVVLIRKRFWRPSTRTLMGLLVTAAGIAATTRFPGAIGVVFAVLTTAALAACLARPEERTRILRSLAVLRRT